MSRRFTSRYVFETSNKMRTFRHQRVINDLSMDCETCHSSVEEHEPFSHHWLVNKDSQHLQMSLEEKILLKRIDRERIETFMLCDESAIARTNNFLLEAGMEAVPQLLRYLSYQASWLEVTIGFFVNVNKKHMYNESTSLRIYHHLDIEESVDMIFSLLLEKTTSYVLEHQRVPLEACSIKRIKLIVKRHWDGEQRLPLQFRVKGDSFRLGPKKSASVDLTLLTESYLANHGKPFARFPDSLQVNLYCLRVCATSKELYAVPYLLRSENVNGTPTYLIQTNVAGEFRGMREIRNIRRFLRSDSQDHLFACHDCKMHFSVRSQFALHKQISCGHGFVITHIKDTEVTEVYENCLLLPKKFFKFAWFGIGATQ